ncbi:hypothetical protein [Streptomyces hiroshimensis]|uniref:Uncharacterized protein n=1 Tax=Streptomyces hiroshimensis TaxID=66424 RepID=A0ABQ2YDR6_9ACTN|nr:hypothetical protein [Streptomyces hiroshimensis]GGX79076.1 hypothetical protein GCM10010324_25800 [Streptomyces hiroshimensis]
MHLPVVALPKWAAAAIAAVAVLAGGTFVAVDVVTASSSQGAAGTSDQALLDIHRTLNFRNITNGPVEVNLLANTRNVGGFYGAVSSEIGSDGEGGTRVSVGAHL